MQKPPDSAPRSRITSHSRKRAAETGVPQELLAAAGNLVRSADAARAHKEFSDLSGRNYLLHLARHFDPVQMSELLAQLQRSLPNLNRGLFGETDTARLTAVAKELGATLQLQSLRSPDIRGFYVNDSALSAQPLIVLNTSYSPIGVAAAFWHEIGHHLTHEIFGKKRDRLNLTFSSGYHEHLDQPEELVADMITTLGAYPAMTARRLFASVKQINSPQGSLRLVTKATRYLRSISGSEALQQGPPNTRLHIIAGMIHVAKLRTALLEGYGI